MGELKPCPFCGGGAEVYDYEYGTDPAVAYGCKCEQYGIAMSGYDSYSEAVEAWNTRHERTCRNDSESGFLCSACKFGDFGGFHGYKPNYCPNCGARVVE